MAQYNDPQACEDCGSDTQKLSSVVNHSFAHNPVGGPRPQNTGVHSIDYNADQVIGRDAENKKRIVEDRQKYKQGLIKAAGVTGKDLSRTIDGDYRVMSSTERTISETSRKIAHPNSGPKQTP